jgi:adenylate kinase
MEKGQLVPDEITIQMVLERLGERDVKNGAILDGFPRNLEQARALDKALARQSRAIDKVVYIKVSEKELLKRLGGRWISRADSRGKGEIPFRQRFAIPNGISPAMPAQCSASF